MSEFLAESVALNWRRAAPFWAALLLVPVAITSALVGGWTVLLLPLVTWYLFAMLDLVLGTEQDNMNPDTGDAHLTIYTAVTLIWAPLQFGLLFWMIWYATGPGDAHLKPLETIGLFFGMGVISGTIGINFAHELMHQKSRTERRMADVLLAMVMYSHFRSEHLLVHHRYVGTPKDPVTARYNEGFFRFFARVLPECYVSAFRAEAALQARKGNPWYARANPFWIYWGLQAFFVTLAVLLGGWIGLALFLWQAFIAIWQLELVNYVEHYGLTRKHLGDGKYEHVRPHHSWNASQKASNWLLINLQRHSDHHYKPSRRFPLLQNYADEDAPQLPYGYPVMTVAAMIPPLWRRIMNVRVRNWRKTRYPEIVDWRAYNTATHPPPR
ncbi:MAG: alkane 1-monooxygenase [Pseudomonadota bacterium]